MFSLTVKSEKAAFAVVSMTVDSQLRKRTIEGFCDSAYPSSLKREKKLPTPCWQVQVRGPGPARISPGLSGMASVNGPKETHQARSLVEAETQLYAISLLYKFGT